MPKQSIDYSRTYIYKIVCNNLDVKDCYVGHTTNFIKRKHNHKHDCCSKTSKNYNHNVYNFIRENGGWDNWSMVLIEEYECKSGIEAVARERYWYEILGATLNGCVPNRNKKEWNENNKEKIIEQQKKYYDQHKEYIENYRKQKIVCECGGHYLYPGKSSHLKTTKHLQWTNKNLCLI